MLIGVTVNNRGEKDQLGKTGLELYGCLVWLALAGTLRTESLELNESQVGMIKEILTVA